MTDPTGLNAMSEADRKEVGDAVLRELTAIYGPGCNNGIAAILSHNDLPAQFDKHEWVDWFFKPAPEAFAKAHDMGLIAPWKLSSKWVFTTRGLAASAAMQASAAQVQS